MKAYAIEHVGIPIYIYLDRDEATKYAEAKYGSRQDGVCVDGIEIVEYKLTKVENERQN